MTKRLSEDDRDDKIKIDMPCLNCGKILSFSPESYEARGIFNVFCRGGDCEDRFAARL